VTFRYSAGLAVVLKASHKVSPFVQRRVFRGLCFHFTGWSDSYVAVAYTGKIAVVEILAGVIISLKSRSVFLKSIKVGRHVDVRKRYERVGVSSMQHLFA
jgi:hypothetical protein